MSSELVNGEGSGSSELVNVKYGVRELANELLSMSSERANPVSAQTLSMSPELMSDKSS